MTTDVTGPCRPTRAQRMARTTTVIAAGIGLWAVGSATATADAAPASPAASDTPMWWCRSLPMILIYPPPPTTVECVTPLGPFRFQLPPGAAWPS
ncbi:hypothetical protein [Gordonia soli]|uniref:Uncharacterized protein n=1 Tax=Gordonia soli NBRC 108243 TaxID=1223545 RepID=M0QEW3_9ACTN|nr:hypothetical protein [Gordonia soli]GAC67150.1 hypothetical protein GS4_05_03640 [Gordonia soli NBRC 108243]